MQEPVLPQQTNDEVIDLLGYLEIIARRWRMIAKVTVATFVLSIIVALLLPKIYSSTAKILPPHQDQGLLSAFVAQMGGGALDGLSGGLLGAVTPADMYATVLQSEDIKGAIVDRFKLMEVYGNDCRVEMFEKVDEIVEVKAGKKDGVISITVEDEDPKRAAAIAGAYLNELSKLVAEMSVSSAAVNRNFLGERLVKAKADLAKAEENLKTFQSRSKVLDVTEQAKAAIGGIAQLQAQLVTQETQLAALRSRFTDTTQEVMDLKAGIANLRRQIAQMEGKGNGSTIIPTGSVPQVGQEYVRLMREFKIQETLVELLTKQYELAKFAEAKNVSNIQVVQKPQIPDKKTKPKRMLIVLGATFMAFFSSVFWVLVRDFLKNIPEEDRTRLSQLKAAFVERHSSV